MHVHSLNPFLVRISALTVFVGHNSPINAARRTLLGLKHLLVLAYPDLAARPSRARPFAQKSTLQHQRGHSLFVHRNSPTNAARGIELSLKHLLVVLYPVMAARPSRARPFAQQVPCMH